MTEYRADLWWSLIYIYLLLKTLGGGELHPLCHFVLVVPLFCAEIPLLGKCVFLSNPFFQPQVGHGAGWGTESEDTCW